MRNITTKNVLVMLLLLAFLITNVGNAFGYAWCFGDNGHSKIEQASLNGCADKSPECSANLRDGTENFSNNEGEQCSPCSDLLIERSNAVVSKRVVKDAKVVLATKAQTVSSPVASNQQIYPKSISQTPRVSQAIIAHRTVVLLN